MDTDTPRTDALQDKHNRNPRFELEELVETYELCRSLESELADVKDMLGRQIRPLRKYSLPPHEPSYPA